MWFIDFITHIRDWTGWLDTILIPVYILLFLPMSFSRKTRMWAAVGFIYGSFAFGVYVWTTSFLFTFYNLGLAFLIVGLLFMGLGIVPMAFLTALFHGDWSGVGVLILYLLITFGSRFFGAYIATKHEEQAQEEQRRIEMKQWMLDNPQGSDLESWGRE
jgi:hypothetical protein